MQGGCWLGSFPPCLPSALYSTLNISARLSENWESKVLVELSLEVALDISQVSGVCKYQTAIITAKNLKMNTLKIRPLVPLAELKRNKPEQRPNPVLFQSHSKRSNSLPLVLSRKPQCVKPCFGWQGPPAIPSSPPPGALWVGGVSLNTHSNSSGTDSLSSAFEM